MSQKIKTQIVVACRILVELLLNLVGLFRIKPLFQSKQTGRKQIAFQAYSSHLAQLYQTIILELLKESDWLEVVFIILPHPHFSIKSTLDLKSFVNSRLHVPQKNIRYYWQILWEKFDLIMFIDVYAKFPPRPSKHCLLKHGPGLTTRCIYKHFSRKTIADFDLVLTNGGFDYKMIRETCKGKYDASKLHNIGFPFLDRFDGLTIDKETYLRKLFKTTSKMTVLFAPSWSGLRLLENNGRDYFDQIVSILRTMNLNTVVKLHACSFNKIFAGVGDWKTRLTVVSKYENIRVDYDVDDIPALKYCDVLITDISSRAFNFMLLDKPVVFYFPSKVLRDFLDAERIELLKRGAFVASSPQGIKEVLNQLMRETVSKPDSKYVSEYCFTNYGKATEAVVTLLKENLNYSATGVH